MTLTQLAIGQTATVIEVAGEGSSRQHFLDMGVLPGAEITLVKYAPMGDPMELRVHGYELTLRKEDAKRIEVTLLEDSPTSGQPDLGNAVPETIMPMQQELQHPGLGEGGHYHEQQEREKAREHSQQKTGDSRKMRRQDLSRRLNFALVGNQNCGKTTLFNQLTGSNQHVGNFPGVTVDRKDGTVIGHPEATVTDLPGIYSLSPYTSEEVVSRRFILDEAPSAIINIVDATCLGRHLYLTMQLMELGIPMVLALNMMDELKRNHGAIRINEMEALLGIPVVPISAMTGEGVSELLRHALHVARHREGPLRHDYCSSEGEGGAVHRGIHAIMHLIEDHAEKARLPIRFAAAKLTEGDPLVREALALSTNEEETVEHILRQMEEERGMDRQVAIATMRYEFIRNICQQTVVRPKATKEYLRSQAMDTILTGKWTALPTFFAIMAAVFYLTFDGLGGWCQQQMELGVEWISSLADALLTSLKISPVVHSLVIDGIFAGVGTVIVFLPLIILLFFFLSMMEDSGYMARIAFVMDRPLRKLGLSGRSIVPLLLGFGCSVPSVMSSRTLPSVRDRRLTIMLTPFMSCTAKIPIYAFFATVFFPENTALVMGSLYVIGIVVGIVVAMIMKKTWFRGEAVPFVMELPNYRMPLPRNVMRLLGEKAGDFLHKAFTLIFVASMVIWAMQTFTFHLDMVSPGEESSSMLAQMAGLLRPIFSPLGLGDWRIITSLVSGMLAKEVVVSTLSALFSREALMTTFSAGSAYAMMVFCLLYTPCIAAMATIRRELSGTWSLIIMCFQCVIAWVMAFGVITLYNLLR